MRPCEDNFVWIINQKYLHEEYQNKKSTTWTVHIMTKSWNCETSYNFKRVQTTVFSNENEINKLQ